MAKRARARKKPRAYAHAHLPVSRRYTFTPELLAEGRRRYEETEDRVVDIAADFGVHPTTLQRRANRDRWVRYVPPPRDLTPAAKLALRAEKLAGALHPPLKGEGRSSERSEDERGGVSDRERSPPPAGRRFASAGDLPPPGGGEERAEPPRLADTAATLHGELQLLLADVRGERERMKRDGYGKHDLREMSGTIASLGAVLRSLQPLLPSHQGYDTAHDDLPADIDAFRNRLARRIAAFMESRPDGGDAEPPAAAAVERP
jgi:transposase-like protein